MANVSFCLLGLEANRAHMILGLVVRHRVSSKRASEASTPEHNPSAAKKPKIEHKGAKHKGITNTF